jgi:ribose transport system ATP-binding protein
VIEIRNVAKTFPGHRVLEDVSLDISPGQIHALVGENGSGKSTLIKILAGYYAADEGASITVDGEQLVGSSVHASHKMGLRFVHQHLALVAELDATDNIALEAGYVIKGNGLIDWQATAAKARAVLAELEVDVDLRVPVGQLRDVDRSSIAIARAMDRRSGDIRCIALDEPTAALPPAEVDALKRLVRRVAESGVSVLYVSHRLAEILDLATHVTVLRDGRLVWSGEATGLTRSRLVELILGRSPESVDSTRGATARPDHAGSASDRRFVVRGLRTKGLRGIDLDLRAGEVLGVAGLDGSGRQDVVLGLGGAIDAAVELRLPSGQVLKRVTPRVAKRIGFALTLANREVGSAVGQFAIKEDLSLPTIGSICTKGGLLHRGREESSAENWIRRLDVRPPRSNAVMGKLSGGNQQKAIIGKWLNTDPSVMLYNDPTSGVDVGSRQAIYEIIREQAATGVAVVVSSSDLEDLTSVCDRVAVLVNGSVSAEVTGDAITEPRLLHAMTEGLSDATSLQ